MPTIAKPLPPSRPALLRISESDKCPKRTAAIALGGKKNRTPQTRLNMAFPLGSGGSPNATPGSSGGLAEVAKTALPQIEQKLSPSDKLLPQPAQNELMHHRSAEFCTKHYTALCRSSMRGLFRPVCYPVTF